MKPKSIKSLLALALLAPGVLFAQTTAKTTPVGYVTTVLAPNKYNLISVTTHQPTIASGVISAEAADKITTTGVNFSTLLTEGSVYILELPDGTIQEVSSWTATELNTPQDISGVVTPGVTKYNLRLADTVASVFGATNSAGLTADDDEDYTNNDLVLIPNSVGAFDTVYYFEGDAESAGWYDAEGNPANNRLLNYADGFFVQRGAGEDISLVIDGEVKKAPTSGVLASGYNFLGGVAPAGSTLASSNLKDSVTIATNETEAATTADYVLFQLPSGAYRTAYYFDDAETAGWFDTEGNPADDAVIENGFLIQNRGVTAKPYKINLPTLYSTL
jgi:hypothetical protein